MKEFSYAQELEYHKDNFDDFKEQNQNLLFEQDGASCQLQKNQNNSGKFF